MRLLKVLSLGLSLLLTTSLFAQTAPPLKVAVESFLPPFVLQGANKQLYGFDISMVNHLCQSMNRHCIYEIYPFDELLNAVAEGKADLAVSAISITKARAEKVNFSLPYMLSYARIIAGNRYANQPFSLELLNNKRYGIEQGSIFAEVLDSMGVKNFTTKQYLHFQDMLYGLANNEIDMAIIDDPGQTFSNFWKANSDGKIQAIGPSFSYGSGLGIAINRNQPQLLQDINQALLEYQKNGSFERDYHKYIGGE